MASTPRIFFSDARTPGQTLILPASLAHRLREVVRMQVGDGLFIFNDCQDEFTAYVVQSDRHALTIRLGDRLPEAATVTLHATLIQGISKGERMDYTLQKATELGVKHIFPVLTEYCQIPRQEKFLQNRISHWQGILVSAAEQCGRREIPVLYSVQTWLQCLQTHEKSDGLKLIAEPAQDFTCKQLPAQATDVIFAVGPEGGFSSNEITAAMNADFQPIALGPRILRTETVAAVLLAILQHKYGDL
jgi:16S rRNA (uracil1498-N3)-methyltransferase